MSITQLLTDAMMTVAFLVGLVIVISAWVVTASALHQRHERSMHIRAIEQHLADAAGQSQVPAR
jgi:lipopolysaccharide export LptBFGC system permease protein LptF